MRAKQGAPSHDPSDGRWGPGDLYFPYEEEDLRLLFLTRSLVRLAVSRGTYRALFGHDMTDHFGPELDAIVSAGLGIVEDDAIRLTPRGVFYADAVAGLLASHRSQALRPAAGGRHTADLLGEEAHHFNFMG